LDGLEGRHESIDLCRHHKVVSVNASYRVSPKSHRYLTPFGQNGGMMAFRFRESTNPVREAQGLCKIGERKPAFQSQDGLPFHHPPAWNLKLQFLNFLLTYPRRTWPTGGTFFVSEYAHGASPFVNADDIPSACHLQRVDSSATTPPKPVATRATVSQSGAELR